MGVHATDRDAALALATQQRVARELVRATDLDEAAPGILAAIGEALGWDVAALWEVRPGEDSLRFVAGWEARVGEAEEFWRLARELRFERGEVLPGRAWQTGEPVWRVDLSGDSSFPRLEAAGAAGLGVGLAMPVPIGAPDRVVAVMELFARRGEAPEPAMRELLAGFGDQIAQFQRRCQAEAAVRRLATIVQTTDEAVGSLDLEGNITSWNPGAERMYGYGAEDVLGRSMRLLVPHDRHDEAGYLLETLRGGHAIEGFETERIRADGARIAVSLTLNPITDSSGAVTGISVVGRDITERRRAEAAKEFLAGASAALDASLDPEQTLRTIVRTAVPELAELCVIDLLAQDGSIGRAVAAASDPELACELEEIRARFPLDPAGHHPVARVLRTGDPVVLRDLSEPHVIEQVAQSDAHRDFMRRAGYRSAAVVAMWARGRTLGAISFLQVRSGRRYDPEDLALLQDLGSRAAMALDNARLYAERSHVARTLQRGLLPATLPELPGVEVAAAYRPASEGLEVGGDFYDAFEAGEDWVFAVGDVCGKGAEAAALTSLMRYSVRAFALEHASPSRVLELVNEAMLHEDLGDRFATAALARFDPAARPARAVVAVAGHPTPIVARADGSAAPAGGRGTLLGVMEDITLPEQEVWLVAGDCLVLYTDGVLDAGAPRRVLSPDDLAAELRGVADEGAEAAVRRVVDMATGLADGPLRDDVAVLAIRLV